MMFSANPNDELMDAATRGDIDTIKLCLTNGADIKTKNAEDMTALHLAAEAGYTGIVECLLENGADIKARSAAGHTVLHWAAARGHADTVKFLLEQGADITTRDSWSLTALHAATYNRHTGTVELLLQHNIGLLGLKNQEIEQVLALLNSPQLNSMQPNTIEMLYPHPNKAEHWITNQMELEALSPADKLALAYKWPDSAARNDTIPRSIKILTKGIMLERRAIRRTAEYFALFRKLKQLFEETPTLRKETLGALSDKKEKTEYKTVLFAFDVFKNIVPDLQLQICMKATGANQEPTEAEVNAAMGRLTVIQETRIISR